MPTAEEAFVLERSRSLDPVYNVNDEWPSAYERFLSAAESCASLGWATRSVIGHGPVCVQGCEDCCLRFVTTKRGELALELRQLTLFSEQP